MKQRGFTLLEVLVAVAILGLGLTMILSSQVGLFASASRAEHLTVATNLARCRMSETELDLMKKGFPVIDQTDELHCCADDDEKGYRCSVKIERVTLPEAGAMAGDGGVAAGPEGALGSLGALAELQTSAQTSDKPPTPDQIQEALGSGALASGIGPLVMGFVYPDLKLMLEASIRRVTVTVLWKEGSRERELAVTQFVTDPQQGGLGEGILGDGGASDETLEPGGSTIPGLNNFLPRRPQ